MKYRKKPVVIEAFCLRTDSFPDWFMNQVAARQISIFHDYCLIETLEGTMTANNGDYVIKGVQGEIYPCKPDIFKETYEAVL